MPCQHDLIKLIQQQHLVRLAIESFVKTIYARTDCLTMSKRVHCLLFLSWQTTIFISLRLLE